MKKNLFPIKYVAKKTGLSTLVIRAWERRYCVVKPHRTETNRRLYCEEDIERLQLLASASRAGFNIGTIAGESIANLKSLLAEKNTTVQNIKEFEMQEADTDEKHILFLNECIAATKQMDARYLEHALLQASVDMNPNLLIEKIIIPFVHQIGEMWRAGEMRVVQEHLATTVLRSFLGNFSGTCMCRINENAPKIITTTPAGQLHELGAMIVTVIANEEGWNCTYLGPNIPAEEIAAAAKIINPRAVSLSIVYPEDDPSLINQIRKLRTLLPDEVDILAGGRAVHAYKNVLDEAGSYIHDDISNLRDRLYHLRSNNVIYPSSPNLHV